VKNATGPDSPDTCRSDQLRQAARWLRAAGVPVPTDPSGLPPFAVEVSPLFADEAGAFAAAWARLAAKPPVRDGLYLE
jgi:UDP-N-acetylglucosamine/UDP-N-acetylgalactosamine diphosphorylase